MAKEVIQYVQEIEMQIANQKKETQQAIEEIKTIAQNEIGQLHQQFEEKLSAHRAEREYQKDERLTLDQAYFDQQVAQQDHVFQKVYNQKHEEMAKQIVEEVLNQYGYRQDEEVNTVS